MQSENIRVYITVCFRLDIQATKKLLLRIGTLVKNTISYLLVYTCFDLLSLSDQVKSVLDEILEKLPEEFNMLELQGKTEEKTPYILVALQECERMNVLTREIRRSLKELDLGLKVGILCSPSIEYKLPC